MGLYDACFVWGFVRSGLVCMGVYGEYMEIIRRLLCMGIRKKWSCLYGSVWRVFGCVPLGWIRNRSCKK